MSNSSSPTISSESTAALRLALSVTHISLVITGMMNLPVIFLVIIRPYMRTITNVYMVSLCLADFMYLVSLAPVAAAQLNHKSWPFGLFSCSITNGAEATGKYASVLFVVLLAADRYCAMCLANMCARYRNYRNALILTAAAWFVAFFLSVPLYFVSNLVPIKIGRQTHTLCMVQWPWRHLPRIYVILSSILIFVLPMIIIVYCYYKIINKLREAVSGSKRLRRGGSSSRAPYQRVTRLVLWVVIFHVICWSPYWMFVLLSSLLQVKMKQQIERIIVNVIHLFPYVNCALNPLLYAVTADNFRTAFKSVFCCKKETDDPEAEKAEYQPTRSAYYKSSCPGEQVDNRVRLEIANANGSPLLGRPLLSSYRSSPSNGNGNSNGVESLGRARSGSVGRLSVRRSFCNADEVPIGWRQCSQEEIRRISRISVINRSAISSRASSRPDDDDASDQNALLSLEVTRRREWRRSPSISAAFCSSRLQEDVLPSKDYANGICSQ